MNNDNHDKDLVYSYDEVFLIHAVLRETFLGFRLSNNEKKIVNKELGYSLERRVYSLFKAKQSEYQITFSLDDLILIRNALIVVMIEFDKYDIYHVHMGRTLDDCLMLLQRIDFDMVNWKA